jgi:hypothetical protein
MDVVLGLSIALSAAGLLLLGGLLFARRREAAKRARANSQLPPLISLSAHSGNGVAARDSTVDLEMQMVDGRSVRFYQPLDGTLRMLPGRLEIVDGEDQGRDIRFVETSDGIPEITFGRSSGPPHRHVQLLSRTVSRRHAVIEYDSGRWRITNLSRTNPVVVNDAELDTPDGQRVLSDGDRIEMGEVIFRYHER